MLSLKYCFIIIFILFAIQSNAQSQLEREYHISISPAINSTDSINQAITSTTQSFLYSKNNSLTENDFWLESDFKKYNAPFQDIYNIEHSKWGNNYYTPTILEIIPTNLANIKLVKIAFIGHHSATNENQLRAIYNVVANISPTQIKLSKYVAYATSNWKKYNHGSIQYYISPLKNINKKEIQQQLVDIEKITTFFNCAAIPISYYSCTNPIEVFQIRGFDYNPLMYLNTSGGFAESNTIYSGNNAEIYTHEIIHIYINHLFPYIHSFLNEGIATFAAGSGKYNYEWHRNKLIQFLKINKTYDIAAHTEPFERIYYEQETSIPYITAALIMEYTLDNYGKNGILDLLSSKEDLWSTLHKIGLTPENINTKLSNQLNRPSKTLF